MFFPNPGENPERRQLLPGSWKIINSFSFTQFLPKFCKLFSAFLENRFFSQTSWKSLLNTDWFQFFRKMDILWKSGAFFKEPWFFLGRTQFLVFYKKECLDEYRREKYEIWSRAIVESALSGFVSAMICHTNLLYAIALEDRQSVRDRQNREK